MVVRSNVRPSDSGHRLCVDELPRRLHALRSARLGRSPGFVSMETTQSLPPTLALLHSERPRNVNWFQSGALLFGDWGTSRLYVLGLAFLVAGRSSFWLIAAMSLLILVVGWAYTHICRLYPDGVGVYTAGRRRARILGVIGALLLFADYTITASLSRIEAFHYFGLGDHEQHTEQVWQDPGDYIPLPAGRDDGPA